MLSCMKNRQISAFGCFLLLLAPMSKAGTILDFNFNSLSSGATASQIAAYMTNALQASGCTGCSVTVEGAVADQTYTADGNVVGPREGNQYDSLTLGDSNGATNSNGTWNSSHDTFIANTSDSGDQVSTEMSLMFTGLTISSLSFDFEIFPDINCPSLSDCGSHDSNLPDFELTAGTGTIGSGSAVTAFGTNGFVYGVLPGTTNGTLKTSPDGSDELAPQYIGVSGNLAVSNVTDLNFVDWPATIGVDNLQISYTADAPEPNSLLLAAIGFGLIGISLRRKKA